MPSISIARNLSPPLNRSLGRQTRLPGELASELEGIAAEYEGDLMFYQQEALDTDTEDEVNDEVEPLRPLRNFPAVALVTAIHSAFEVCLTAPQWPL